MKGNKFLNDDIVIYHIGGDEKGSLDLGPIQRIVDSPDIKSNIQIVLFDIREGVGETITVDKIIREGVRLRVVSACIFSEKTNREFHVNKQPLSSSIFPPSPIMKDEHIMYPWCHTWEEDTDLDFKMNIETNTLDCIIKELDLPQPDILSMDIQGAELAALQGATKVIQNELLCIVTEIEFCEIYKGQGLFHQQHELLFNNGFRLVDIFSHQYWHPAPAIGKGLLTVGEALYFRYFDLDNYGEDNNQFFSQLLKLSEISFAFSRYSFSNKIVDKIIKNYPKEIDSIKNSERYKPIFDKYQFVNDNLENYNNNNRFFMPKSYDNKRYKAYQRRQMEIVRRFTPNFIKYIIRKWLY